MTLDWTRDDANRRVVLVGAGEFGADEILDAFRRLRTEGAWRYGVLFDLRGVTTAPTIADLRRFTEAATTPHPLGEERGPLALVVTDQALYAMGCAYAALSRTTRIEIFRDLVEAQAWLRVATTRE